MTDNVIQIRDHQSKRQRDQAEAALRGQTLEQQAVEIAHVALIGIPYGGQGIDGMDFDTAPSEMNPDQTA